MESMAVVVINAVIIKSLIPHLNDFQLINVYFSIRKKVIRCMLTWVNKLAMQCTI